MGAFLLYLRGEKSAAYPWGSVCVACAPRPQRGWQGLTGISGSFQAESVATFDRNGWQASTGISGNLRPEYARCTADDYTTLEETQVDEITWGTLTCTVCQQLTSEHAALEAATAPAAAWACRPTLPPAHDA